MRSYPPKGRRGSYPFTAKTRSGGGSDVFWWWIWVAAKYPIAIGVPPPSLREDERDIGHGSARLRESTDSDLPDASASMRRLISTSLMHQQGPESKIWPSCCSRRSTGSGRRWRPRKLLTHQEQVRNHVGRVFGDPRDPIALTCCAPLNPRRWRTGASCPSTTSPLYHKAALAMYFRPWGVASCLLVQFLLAQLAKEAREKAAMAGRVSVPL